MKKIAIMVIIVSMILSASVCGNGSEPPVAQCRDVIVEVGAGCEADAFIDDGSFDPEGVLILIEQEPPGPYPLGETIVTLTVTDDSGNEASCTGRVEVVDTTPPVVICQDVIVLAGEDGTAEASIDGGSYDFCPVTIVQSPPGPYGVGVHLVTLTATDSSGNQDSCQATVVVEAPVAIDIKPGSCPNPLNVKSKSTLSVAVLGSESFDVGQVDPASVRLEGVGAERSSYEDASSPLIEDDCACTTDGPDGYMDLILKFDTQLLVAAIGEVEDAQELQLHLTGNFYDGTVVEATDCILIIEKGR